MSRVEQARSRLGRALVSWVKPPQPRDGRPEALRVEAVTYLPHRERYVWTTTTDHVARVIAQIGAGLEHGQLARPLGAVFRGNRS